MPLVPAAAAFSGVLLSMLKGSIVGAAADGDGAGAGAGVFSQEGDSDIV